MKIHDNYKNLYGTKDDEAGKPTKKNKHTSSPINDFEGFLHMFYCRIKHFTESLTEKLLRQVG
jgi:hypothetical protein